MVEAWGLGNFNGKELFITLFSWLKVGVGWIRNIAFYTQSTLFPAVNVNWILLIFALFISYSIEYFFGYKNWHTIVTRSKSSLIFKTIIFFIILYMVK